MYTRQSTITPGTTNLVAEIAGFVGRMADSGMDSRYEGDYPANLLKYDPYSVRDLLRVHSDLMYGIDDEPGEFRVNSLGVYIDDELVHAGSRPRDIPRLVDELLEYTSNTNAHPLIKGLSVRFWIDYIQPFNKGSSEVGALWQAIIYRQWKDIFRWLPLEDAVNQKQQGYEESLVASYRSASADVYIEFMLQLIYETLSKLPENRIVDIFNGNKVNELPKLDREFLEKISSVLDNSGAITNREAQELTGLSSESVKKYFARLVSAGLLDARGENKGRKYIFRKGG